MKIKELLLEIRIKSLCVFRSKIRKISRKIILIYFKHSKFFLFKIFQILKYLMIFKKFYYNDFLRLFKQSKYLVFIYKYKYSKISMM